jgi:hypothetical protein
MKPKTSPLWDHCKEKVNAAHLVICDHCSLEIKRGKPDSSRATWTLKSFKYHLEKKHPDAFKKVEQKQSIATVKIDPKDETVRGTVPLFRLRNHKERQMFLKKVHIS